MQVVYEVKALVIVLLIQKNLLTFGARAATKTELARLFEARQVIQFAEFYPVGHRSTNYKKFFESDVPYPIKFKSGYEPYVLVSRKHMPWYDERFRGYGWDKVISLALHLSHALMPHVYYTLRDPDQLPEHLIVRRLCCPLQ